MVSALQRLLQYMRLTLELFQLVFLYLILGLYLAITNGLCGSMSTIIKQSYEVANTSDLMQA